MKVKLWFVESGTGDNYVIAETQDGLVFCDCSPTGEFAEVDLYSYGENGERIPGEVIAAKIAAAVDPNLDESDFDYMEPCWKSFDEWQAEQDASEDWQRDRAFPIDY